MNVEQTTEQPATNGSEQGSSTPVSQQDQAAPAAPSVDAALGLVTRQDGSQKFGSVDQLADSYNQSQSHIARIEAENKELRDLLKATTEQTSTLTQKTSELEEALKALSTPSTSSTTSDTIDESTIGNIVNQKILAMQAEANQNKVLSEVATKVKELGGEQANELWSQYLNSQNLGSEESARQACLNHSTLVLSGFESFVKSKNPTAPISTATTAASVPNTSPTLSGKDKIAALNDALMGGVDAMSSYVQYRNNLN